MSRKLFIERLLEKIECREPNECWPWTGMFRKGYGRIKGGDKFFTAHRAIFALTQGIDYWQAPEVLHSCDNPRCCNPKHLRAGTQQDNMNDRETRDRAAPQFGSHNGNATLTEEQARAAISDQRPLRIIAAEYGVRHQTIWKLKSGRTWNH